MGALQYTGVSIALQGGYQGTLEVTQEVSHIRALEGE